MAEIEPQAAGDFVAKTATRLGGQHHLRTAGGGAGEIDALESAHAVAHAMRHARENPDQARSILVNLSGRGDKDMDYMIEHYGNGGEFRI